ncbi:MAG: SHOCT domain-containing protein, partial [Specibacter sp.]
AAEQQMLAQQAQMLPVPEAGPVATAPVAAAPVATAPAEDLLSKLERLAALHASGALNDAEFAAVKASIIG